MGYQVDVFAFSDIGCVRTNNEDSFGYDPEHQVYVVCDGMGGMASGEVASQMAVTAFLQAMIGAAPATALESSMNHAIAAANRAVNEAGQDPQHHGMGTTLVAACVQEARLYIGNVGDSRAYLIKGHQCMQLTVDHSFRNELIRTGKVKVEDADNFDLTGLNSVITRAIGVAPKVEPDFFALDLDVGDIVLLASDGLTRYVKQSEISLLVGACDLATTARNMVAVAKERGGADNITVLLLQLISRPNASGEEPPSPLA